jgi:hypothetical protein
MEAILDDFHRTLSAYARAQLISCFVIGVLCTVGFLFDRFELRDFARHFSGIFEFIPVNRTFNRRHYRRSDGELFHNPWDALYAQYF